MELNTSLFVNHVKFATLAVVYMLTIRRSTPNVGADFQLSASSSIGSTEIQSDYSVNWVKVIYYLQFIIYYLQFIS